MAEPKTLPRGTHNVHILEQIGMNELTRNVDDLINSLRKDYVHYL